MCDAELAKLTDSFHLPNHASALAFVDRLFTRPNLLRQAYAFGVRRSFGRPEMKTLLASMKKEDLLRPEDLQALEVPVLLVWGQQDRILPPSSLAFFKEHLPAHARIEEPEAFGHSPFLEHPRELASHIEGFLEALTPRPEMVALTSPTEVASAPAAVGETPRRAA